MSIIESIRDYISAFPYIDELNSINVDYLSNDANNFSIEETPSQSILIEYLDGSTQRQFTFVLSARFYYSDEVVNNINNSGFFEKFQEWLFRNSRIGYLPTLEDGMIPEQIEALSSGYLYNMNSDVASARYQIQCRLIYEKERT